jgi:tetratricopeptide (TPR) repeat protein
MIRGLNGRHLWLVACAALFALALAMPASAQSTGMIRGVVKDATGKTVEGAKVSIDAEANNRHFDTKSDKKGEFVQIGLPPGSYKVTAEKDKLVSAPIPPISVRIASSPNVTLILGGGGAAGGASPEALAKNAELKKTFEEGVAASRAGNHDAAIAAFAHAAELNDKCYDCYYNIAFSESQKKDYDKAEAAYKKAIEIKPDYGEAYSGLANIYNASRKFEEAAAASAKAMELSGSAPGALGGNADAMFNQGVILWNAGKIPEARKQFEGAVAANPNHAEAHFQLGMTLVNEGTPAALAAAATEFETYLKIAPAGPSAATAKAVLGSLPKK